MQTSQQHLSFVTLYQTFPGFQELRRQYSGTAPLADLEKFSKVMMQLKQDKEKMEMEMRVVINNLLNFLFVDDFRKGSYSSYKTQNLLESESIIVKASKFGAKSLIHYAMIMKRYKFICKIHIQNFSQKTPVGEAASWVVVMVGYCPTGNFVGQKIVHGKLVQGELYRNCLVKLSGHA